MHFYMITIFTLYNTNLIIIYLKILGLRRYKDHKRKFKLFNYFLNDYAIKYFFNWHYQQIIIIFISN